MLNKVQKHASLTRDILICISFKSEKKLKENFTYVTSLLGTSTYKITTSPFYFPHILFLIEIKEF